MGKDARKIDALIGELARAYGWTDKLKEYKVREAYKKCIDERILAATEDIYVKNRVLYIKIHQAAARNEVQFQLEDFKELINRHLGSTYIIAVKLA